MKTSSRADVITSSNTHLTLPPRIVRLRQMMLDVTHDRYRQTADPHWSILGKCEIEQLSIPERQALAFAAILEKQPIYIQQDELLIGGRTIFGPVRSSSLFNEPRRGTHAFPAYTTQQERDAQQALGFCRYDGVSDNHMAPDFGWLLAYGICGIRNRCQTLLQNADTSRSQKDFWHGQIIACDAMTALIHRYAALARDMSQTIGDAQRSLELEQIAVSCDAIAQSPPIDFRQALQLHLFFLHFMLIEQESFVGPGRFDVNLYPYYRRSIEEGMTQEQAIELLACFFIKMNDQADLSNDDGMNLVVGGVDGDGIDITSDLTYMCLDVCELLGLSDPQLNVRIHTESPDRLLCRCAEVISRGRGMPILLNDQPYIKGLIDYGFTMEDACHYCIDTCEVTAIQGMTRTFRGIFSCLPAIFPALERLGTYRCYDQFESDVLTGIKDLTRQHIMNANKDLRDPLTLSPMLITSMGFPDCVERGANWRSGGLKYQQTSLLMGSIVNLANSLAAVRIAIFDEKWCSAEQLKAALAADFVGYETLHERLMRNAPKWGNDDDRVDLICRRILDCYTDELTCKKNPLGGRWIPGVYEHWQIQHGQEFPATPDGRRSSAPLALNLSADYGTERHGPTAALLSLAKVDAAKTVAENAFDLRFTPSIFAGEGMTAFVQFIRTFIDLNCAQLQVNVVDNETLRAAQRDPQHYRDIIVRVWGFNAYFVELAPEYQENIICRTELGL